MLACELKAAVVVVVLQVRLNANAAFIQYIESCFSCCEVIICFGDSCGWTTRDITVTPFSCSLVTLEIDFGAGSYMGSGEDAWLVVGVISFLPVLVANEVI